MKKRFVAILAFAIFLTGCSVGPDYYPPLFHFPSAWKESPVDVPAAADTHAEIDQQWWKNFNDPVLNDLIVKARANNLDVKISLARIREARAEERGTLADQLPDVTLTGDAARTGGSKNVASGGAPGKVTNLFQTGFDATWEANIFGSKRALEAAKATVEASEEAAHDTMVSLLGDVARNYIAVRNNQNQIEITNNNITAQRDTLALTTSRYQAGLVSQIDVNAAAALLDSTESTLPTLRASLKVSLHALEVLLVEQPGALDILVAKFSPVPVSASDVITGAPADILRNRPDIREAERELAAATAIKGVAMADMFPQISLTSLLGFGSGMASNLLTAPSKTWSLGIGGVLPIFDFGRIRAEIDTADARQEQAFLNYQKAVLNGLEEVENDLVTYNEEAQRLDRLKENVEAQTAVVELTDERYSKGLISFFDVLDAKRLLYSAQISFAQSEASLSTDLVSLYKALGGGWKNNKE